MELKEARKLFKSAGFKLKVQTLSFGRHVDVYNAEGKVMPSIFCGADEVQKWKVAIDLKSSVSQLVDNGEKIYGFNA